MSLIVKDKDAIINKRRSTKMVGGMLGDSKTKIKTYGAKKSDSVTMKKQRFLKRADTIFTFDPKVHMTLTKKQRHNLDELEKYDKYEWFVDVGKNYTGVRIGHRDLIDNTLRQGSVKCLTHCYLVSLSKEYFNSLLLKYETRHLMERLDFLYNLPFLKYRTQN